MEAATMPMGSFGVFGPEALAEMAQTLDAAYKQLQGTGEPDVVRERIATRIIAAARLGERDPARLLEAALRKPD
jgi:hypothetical protein